MAETVHRILLTKGDLHDLYQCLMFAVDQANQAYYATNAKRLADLVNTQVRVQDMGEQLRAQRKAKD